jgi:pimeloyl-ACP methyl ester carboxylesterase
MSEGRIHYVNRGTGSPLILLHPLGTSTWTWEAVIGLLSQRYACYAFDTLGHGLSDRPNRRLSIPDYADALAQALGELSIERADFVGNSVGAVLSIEMAASHPELVDRLVLVGCPVVDPREGAWHLEDGAAAFDDEWMPKPLDVPSEWTVFAEPKREWQEAFNRSRAQAGVWVRQLTEALSYYDVMSRLPLVQARKTLVLNGELDSLRDNEELLLGNIRNASLALMPGVAHLPQVEDPDAFVKALVGFLQT